MLLVIVAMGPEARCKTLDTYRVDAGMGYISSAMMKQSRYGTASCPWQVVTTSGQNIQLDLFTFNKTEIRAHCSVNVVVEDGDERRTINLCKNLRLNDRPEYVYRSKHNQVTVFFEPFVLIQNTPTFLLRYTGMSTEYF